MSFPHCMFTSVGTSHANAHHLAIGQHAVPSDPDIDLVLPVIAPQSVLHALLLFRTIPEMSTGPRLRLIRPWERQYKTWVGRCSFHSFIILGAESLFRFHPGILLTASYKSCSICDLFARSSGCGRQMAAALPSSCLGRRRPFPSNLYKPLPCHTFQQFSRPRRAGHKLP